jgi:Ca2+-binding EF-hand superfamily protein
MRLMGNPDALMNLLKIFNMIDSSGDGYIDGSEVAEIAALLGYR